MAYTFFQRGWLWDTWGAVAVSATTVIYRSGDHVYCFCETVDGWRLPPVLSNLLLRHVFTQVRCGLRRLL